MKFHYKSTGVIKIYDNTIKLLVDPEIVNYYKFVIEKRWYGLTTQLGKFYPHATIVYEKEIKEKKINLSLVKNFNNKKVEFTYDNYINIGGFKKGFRMFWINADFKEHAEIRAILRLEPFIPHITICNTKYQREIPSKN